MKISHSISAIAFVICAANAFAAPDSISATNRLCSVDEQLVSCAQPSAINRFEETLPAAKQTRLGLYMEATEASQWMNQWANGTLFVDVRTLDEISFLGSPKDIDAHVPFMVVSDPPRWDKTKDRYVQEPNMQFVQAIQEQLAKKGLGKASPIVLICREGHRSARAADALANAGYNTVYTVTDGYEGDTGGNNGWRNAKLPWTMNIAQKVKY
jgi:rhodanese-related sulfurtransferase